MSDTLFGIDKVEMLSRCTSSEQLRFLTPLPEMEIVFPKRKRLEHTLVITDVETTGLDKERDEIISLGFIKISFNGNLTECFAFEHGVFYNEPSKEISQEITDLTGLTYADVKGHKLTQEIMDNIFDGSELVVAHHAAFDRPFVDRYYRKDLPWGCTIRDLDLRVKYGNSTSSLASVMAQAFGYYMSHHEALTDCFACYQILEDNLLEMMTKVFADVYRVVAVNSDFMAKDTLKLNGFRWAPEIKSWFKDGVPIEELDKMQKLVEECGGTINISKIHTDRRWSELDN